MAVQKKNLKRLAALSAVGAGALGVGANCAEASIISGTVSSPNVVGWNNPLTAESTISFTLTGSGIQVSAKRSESSMPHGDTTTFYRFISVIGGSTAFQWRVQGPSINLLQMVNSGQKWSTAGGTTGGDHAYPGGRTWVASGGGFDDRLYGPSSINNQYALFRFAPGGGTTLYGWLQLSYAVTEGVGSADELGPVMTVTRWAYDNSGNALGAGAVPEPGTFALAALALGAIGMRRWRSRQTAE